MAAKKKPDALLGEVVKAATEALRCCRKDWAEGFESTTEMPIATEEGVVVVTVEMRDATPPGSEVRR